MFDPWITVPVEDVRVHLPMRLSDDSIKILFRDITAIDKTIEQLEKLKQYMIEEGLCHV